MRFLFFILLSSCFLVAPAQTIICPALNEIKTTEGWALTSQSQQIDWDGALKQDQSSIGALVRMGLVRDEGLNGFLIQCVYTNAVITNVGPITGICDPVGLMQDCTKSGHTCSVECNNTNPPH